MIKSLPVLALIIASSAVYADAWVALPESQSVQSQSGPKAFVDTQSIQILDAGQRRATVKLDFSSRPPDSVGNPAKSLKVWILVTLYDCEKHASRVESSESHFADGSVKSAKPLNTAPWLESETDPAREFVCAWQR